MPEKLIRPPDVTDIDGRISLRLLDIKVTDYGIVDLEARLGEAVTGAVREFFPGAMHGSDAEIRVDLDKVREDIYLDETGNEAEVAEGKVDRMRWRSATWAA